MKFEHLYLFASIAMAIAAILILFARNYLASSAMLAASAFAGDHYRLLKQQSQTG
ncbi:hypothetical protein [Corynebacterium senegalense]|uniref:hypothetical protein n=1 Tax=Corynebacterium senegalense TaxID=2080750 RepID=UPI0015F26F30|nr:hypothetical protein [Corynebacterium senegalense]